MENMGNKNESEDVFETNDQICQKLVEEFASLTSTNEALAQFYLQDRNWNLTTAVNDYFDDLSKQDNQKRKSSHLGTVVSDDSHDSDVQIVAHSSHDSTKKSKTEPNSGKCATNECEGNAAAIGVSNEFRFITWNIDGIDDKNRKLRTEAVSNIIKRENAIIVFLQEVIPYTESILREALPKYQFFSGNVDVVEYYTLTLIHKDFVKLESNEVIEFAESAMGRNLLKTRIKVGQTSICLLNTHLESTKEFARTRMDQLKRAFKEVSDSSLTETVIFAGDLNLRDNELQKVGLPLKVADVWIETGSRKEVEYTWDLTRNDNLQFNGKFKPRCRFDRIFMRESTPARIVAIHFGLIGLQRLKPHVCFPSDHWGLISHFKLIKS